MGAPVLVLKSSGFWHLYVWVLNTNSRRFPPMAPKRRMRLPHICKDAGSLIRFKNIFKYLWDSRFLGQETVNSSVFDRFAPVHPAPQPYLPPWRETRFGEPRTSRVPDRGTSAGVPGPLPGPHRSARRRGAGSRWGRMPHRELRRPQPFRG